MNTRNATEEIYKRLINYFGSIENVIILDYGCGTGGLIKALLEQPKHPKEIYAVDINPTMIEKVNSSFSKDISRGLIKTSVMSDPKELTGTTFDGIFCHNVLELINNKEQFVTALYDLLKKDGSLIISHMDFDSMIYNSAFKELTRKLIHNFPDTKQAWMASVDGQMGRKIPGIIKRAGIEKSEFETWRWTETTFHEKDYGFLLANLLLDAAANSFDAKELLAWKKDLEEKAKNRDYFFAVDIDVTKIKR